MRMTERKKGAAQGAADTLRARILTGRHKPGESLPGERELAAELGISRLTLRSALAHLESEGLVRAVHGSGTRVLDYRETGGVDLLGRLGQLALSGAIDGGLEVFASLLELRRAVAVDAVALAAERATPEELRAMRDHVAMQEKLIDEPSAFMVADLAFARLLVRATRNLGYELLFNTVVRTIEASPGLEPAFTANARATLAVYRHLLDRMEARDAARARATAERLLYRMDRTTIEALEQVLEAARAMRNAMTQAPSPSKTAAGATKKKTATRRRKR
jgi:GntR family transcriptional regulator, transcriptional repressor for pyruvate dehydrogenase complex